MRASAKWCGSRLALMWQKHASLGEMYLDDDMWQDQWSVQYRKMKMQGQYQIWNCGLLTLVSGPRSSDYKASPIPMMMWQLGGPI